MASGDLTASVPAATSTDPTLLKAAIDALNLAATTDTLHIVPIDSATVLVFKVERAA